MRVRRITISIAFAAELATLPLSAAKAQYDPPYSPAPLSWPICAAGAVVVTATTIITAPLRVLTGEAGSRDFPPCAFSREVHD